MPTFAYRFCLQWLLLSTVAAAAETPAVWPQWRGPNRDGIVQPATPWPVKLREADLQQLWRVEELGPSYSGPIVGPDAVYTTATVKGEEIVTAVDRNTGAQRWQVRWSGSMSVPFFAWSNGSWIRSTPALDGDSLYVAGMRDVLVCLNSATGEERWRVDFVKELKTALPAFGFVCSPLVIEDAVYVQAGAGFIKLDKKNGKILWRTLTDDGGMYGSAFSSPILARVAGKSQLLVQTRTHLAGVEPADGAVLWKKEVEAFRGMNIFTPTPVGERGLLTSTYGGRTEFHELNLDGKEIKPSVAWTEKTQGYMSTPIILGDYAYMHLRNQRLCCLDLKSGKVVWTTQPFGKYQSLVAAGELILALDERGELHLFRATPDKFDPLGMVKVSKDPTWAHLAVCGDVLFIREQNALTAWRWAPSQTE